ncbi:MAG TPA: peptidoglycan editing factor PgeF [Williamwhitmania sp.]|nr:peptidoglycan editing factor PgeF [Williamwhitmania sp.]
MIRTFQNGIPVHRFNNLSRFPELVHFVTTRHGGVSQGGDASLNLGFHKTDSDANVRENRLRLAAAVNIPIDNFTHQIQVHSANVTVVDNILRGAGTLAQETAIQQNDALITCEMDICLVTKSADCVPILFYDPAERIAAAVHAGWRGMVQNIAGKTVEEMVLNFGCNPCNILVGIGPANGPCCYEVGPDVEEAVAKIFPNMDGLLVKGKGLRRHLNQWEANRRQLIQAGIPMQNIEVAELCTQCHGDEFYSARLGHTGRFVAGIMIGKAF